MNIDWNIDWVNSIWVAQYRAMNSSQLPNLSQEMVRLINELFADVDEAAAVDSPLALKRKFRERLARDQAERVLGPSLVKLEQELELRLGVAKQEWEARGPGWCFALRKFLEQLGVTDSRTQMAAARLEVVLPFGEPVSWAAGDAEGLGWLAPVMYNISPEFPEWLRVAWLIARREVVSHKLTDSSGSKWGQRFSVGGQNHPNIIDWFAVLLVIKAGSEVDVFPFDEQSLCAAGEFLLPSCEPKEPDVGAEKNLVHELFGFAEWIHSTDSD